MIEGYGIKADKTWSTCTYLHQSLILKSYGAKCKVAHNPAEFCVSLAHAVP